MPTQKPRISACWLGFLVGLSLCIALILESSEIYMECKLGSFLLGQGYSNLATHWNHLGAFKHLFSRVPDQAIRIFR